MYQKGSMHRAAVAAFAAIVVACFGTPGIAAATEGTGDSLVDPIEDADVVLVGQAQDVHPGRVVNGCQFTAATVRVEEVILGELPPSAPGDLTVEFVGDCKEIGALGGAVPAERAIWFLVNKGAWLREFVIPKSGDFSAEDAYWRPLEPDAFAVDHAGALAKHGAGSIELPSVTFDEYVGELRDSAYLRPNFEPQPPIGLGIWFTGQVYLAAAVLFVVALLAAVWAVIVHGVARRVGLVVAGVALVGMGVAVAGGPRLARNVDFAGGIVGRTEVVASVRAGTLEHVESDDYALPTGLEDLSEDHVVQAISGPPTMAFFFTQAFFSPDPYCGYEYAQVPEALVLDPLGSGGGGAEDLGDGWYWICAS
jgi:hypothetical protein